MEIRDRLEILVVSYIMFGMVYTATGLLIAFLFDIALAIFVLIPVMLIYFFYKENEKRKRARGRLRSIMMSENMNKMSKFDLRQSTFGSSPLVILKKTEKAYFPYMGSRANGFANVFELCSFKNL
jgi:hypothetical protein